jgi:hypothetical protein
MEPMHDTQEFTTIDLGGVYAVICRTEDNAWQLSLLIPGTYTESTIDMVATHVGRLAAKLLAGVQ